MTEGVNPTSSQTCDCGCCEGIGAETPAVISNPPGLSAIAYRVGTHAQFKATMLAGLTSATVPALAQLKTREDTDLSIGLVDAWATVADVLSFYQERIANESYLRTATERLSILELAREIGYELRPGVAAGAYLAFLLETAAQAPRQVTIPTGTKVGSIPGPNEQPQTFETIEDIVARPELNALRPLLLQPQLVTASTQDLVVDGLAPPVKAGDRLLVAPSTLATVYRVVPDQDSKTTRLDLQSGPTPTAQPFSPPIYQPASTPLPENTPLTGDIVDSILRSTWDAADLTAQAIARGWSLDDLAETIATKLGEAQAQTADVYAFRTKAAVFGHNAPKGQLPTVPPPTNDDSGEGRTLAQEFTTKVDLDAVYPHIVAGSQAALVGDGSEQIFSIGAVSEASRADFLISAKVTVLQLDTSSAQLKTSFTIRGTTVYAESELLPLAPVPIPDVVEKSEIRLDGFYLGLAAGRNVIVTGELDGTPGVQAGEVATLKQVLVEGGYTVLELEQALTNRYVRDTVTINANVATSTHGESKRETLGSGDGSQPFQRFALRQPPLTYVSAGTASGVDTTLKVYVDGVLWHETPTLYGSSPRDRVYVTRLGDDGTTTVEFGDGRAGARLPTGSENVEARYRKGIGLAGMVKAGQLTLLTTKPLGVKSVANPLDAANAADPEPRDQARVNAPRTVLTLDRVVSDTDYEDFARSFAGIAKALATPLPGPNGPSIVLTIAGTNGADVPEDGLGKKLRSAIVGEGDIGARFQLMSYRPVLFRIEAAVKVDPDYLPERVLPAVEQALRSAFSFDARTFGQHVADSEVIEVMQAVPGVVAVDVEKLYRPPATDGCEPRLWAQVPQPGDTTLLGAELLTLDPRPLDLEQMP